MHYTTTEVLRGAKRLLDAVGNDLLDFWKSENDSKILAAYFNHGNMADAATQMNMKEKTLYEKFTRSAERLAETTWRYFEIRPGALIKALEANSDIDEWPNLSDRLRTVADISNPDRFGQILDIYQKPELMAFLVRTYPDDATNAIISFGRRVAELESRVLLLEVKTAMLAGYDLDDPEVADIKSKIDRALLGRMPTEGLGRIFSAKLNGSLLGLLPKVWLPLSRSGIETVADLYVKTRSLRTLMGYCDISTGLASQVQEALERLGLPKLPTIEEL